MSDRFKRNRPRLSEQEERALWERVRTIPREAGGRSPAPVPLPGGRPRPWWDALWARPAVRFGAPALAVALVAVVWVAQKEPVAPAREEAASRQRAVGTPAPAPGPRRGDLAARGDAADAPLATAPTTSAPEAREELTGPEGKVVVETRTRALAEKSGQTATGSDGRESAAGLGAVGAARSSDAPAAPSSDASPPEAGRSTFAAPPPAAQAVPAPAPTVPRKERAAAPVPAAEPEAVRDFRREDPRVGTIRRADEATTNPARVADERAARGSRTSAALLGDRILVEVLSPSSSGTFLETVTLPLSGGVARIAVGTTPGALVVEDARAGELVRIAGREAGSAAGGGARRIELAPGPSGGAAALVARDGRSLTSRFVEDDGDARALAGPRAGARSRVAALAAELVLAVAAGDAREVARVRDAARRLAAGRPADAAARTLVAWSDDAQAAFAGR